MMTTELHQLMKRDLDLFVEEIKQFPENKLFVVKEGIANSGGTLGLHLAGNLQHYVGTGLGKTPYVRNREYEFSARNIPKQTIIMELKKASDVLDDTFLQLTDENLNDPFPDLKPWVGLSIGFVLGQLLAHLNYHRGQVNYLRRILAGE